MLCRLCQKLSQNSQIETVDAVVCLYICCLCLCCCQGSFSQQVFLQQYCICQICCTVPVDIAGNRRCFRFQCQLFQLHLQVRGGVKAVESLLLCCQYRLVYHALCNGVAGQ